MNMRKALFLAALLCGAGGVALLTMRDAAGTLEVQVAQATHAPLADTLLASGSFAYVEQIQLRPEVSGRVVEVLVEEGQQVEAGQLLMTLDQVSFIAQRESAEAAVRSARLALERLRVVDANLHTRLVRQQQLLAQQLVSRDGVDQLYSQKAVSELQIKEAEQTLVQQLAELNQANEQLRRSQFRAPITGQIVSVDVKAGETVIAGTTNILGSDLMTLADTRALMAELRVDEADIGRVRNGQLVHVYAASAPEQALPGVIDQVGTSARKLGTMEGVAFRVRVRLDDAEYASLAPGMSCRAEIIVTQGTPSINVPVAAIREDVSGHFVWTLDADHRARRVAVIPGPSNDVEQAIQHGLTAKNPVITGPGRVLTKLQEGLKVKPVTLARSAGGRNSMNSSDHEKKHAATPVIELNRAVKRYTQGDDGVFIALDHLSLQIAVNDYVAIVGPSGSGKSTLMNIMGCLDTLDEGHYRLNGRDINGLSEASLALERNHSIGFIFQSFHLLPKVSVLGNVMQPLIYRKVPLVERKRRALDVLERVGLSHRIHHLPVQLSGGQRQRVAIARALVTRPALLLGDEPTGNLDSSTTAEIMALFDALHNDGHTVVLVTHESDIAEHCLRQVRLVDGRVAEDISRTHGAAVETMQ